MTFFFRPKERFIFLSEPSFSSCWGLDQTISQPLPVWPDLAKFRHFGKSLQVFSKFLTVYILFGKMRSLLWHFLLLLGKFSLLEMAKYLKNNLAIWSHWHLQSPAQHYHILDLFVLGRPQSGKRGWTNFRVLWRSEEEWEENLLAKRGSKAVKSQLDKRSFIILFKKLCPQLWRTKNHVRFMFIFCSWVLNLANGFRSILIMLMGPLYL